MDAAGEIGNLGAGLCEHPGRRFDVQSFALMRSDRQGNFPIREAKTVGSAALEQGQRLKGLDRRTGKHRRLDVPEGKQNAAIRVQNGA